MNILNTDIHLWIIDLDGTPNQYDYYLQVLSVDEKARAERFRTSLHQRYFVNARGALRCILSRYLAIDPASIVFAYTPFDKPFLQYPASTLQFNLAHSQHKAIVAVTESSAIGVDLEKVQLNDETKLAERFFHPEEINYIKQQSNITEAFYYVWTRKEAIVKAAGTGFRSPLNEFSVIGETPVAQIIFHQQTWSLTSLPLIEHFASAVASSIPKTISCQVY